MWKVAGTLYSADRAAPSVNILVKWAVNITYLGLVRVPDSETPTQNDDEPRTRGRLLGIDGSGAGVMGPLTKTPLSVKKLPNLSL